MARTKNAITVAVYVRAEDARFLREHVVNNEIFDGEVEAWVRSTVKRAIRLTKEKHERERSD